LESELFGHFKGAFTGALTDRKGQIEAADGGTVFLDEIGEMSLELQVKLLRFMQNAEIRRLGGGFSTKVDVRVLAATHRDLARMMPAGMFREDLYYRLNVIPLKLPSLRERREDIPELVRFFLQRSCSKHARHNLRLGEAVVERFLAYRWPGNVRELENLVERLVVLADSLDVGVADLPEFLRPEPSPVDAINLDLPPNGISLGGIEKNVLLRTLQQFDWNQSKAARYLGLTRKTLAYRVQKYDLLRKMGMVHDGANVSEALL
jgi:two-component system NtrC family response regulator